MAYFYEFQQHICILFIDHNVIVLAKQEYYRFQHVKGVHDDVYVESHEYCSKFTSNTSTKLSECHCSKFTIGEILTWISEEVNLSVSVESPVAKRVIHIRPERTSTSVHAQMIELGMTYPDWLWRMHRPWPQPPHSSPFYLIKTTPYHQLKPTPS